MSGPLSVEFGLSHSAEMVIAVFIGIGFGFVLERAGFGRSDVLAQIFYGRDFRVMRVMFTAIVTAMLGLYFLDLIGIMPLYSIGLLDTYVLPQLLGGLLVGAAFVVGGWCPGTSIVGMVSGKKDALLFVLGVPLGSLVFTLFYDVIGDLHHTGAMGRIILSEFFGIPSGYVVFGVVLFAIGVLFAVTKIEALVNRPRSES